MRRSFYLLTAGALCVLGCERSNSNAPVTTREAPMETSRTDAARNRDATTYDATRNRDNTGINKRDQDGTLPTADHAGQNTSDVTLASDIRKRITDTKMSTNAQNCKVVVQNGKVTLRGPVKDQAEKDQIGKIAADVVGVANVDNQLEIQSNL